MNFFLFSILAHRSRRPSLSLRNLFFFRLSLSRGPLPQRPPSALKPEQNTQGLGLELARQLVLGGGGSGRFDAVIATCRDPSSATALAALAAEAEAAKSSSSSASPLPRLTILPLDVTRATTIDAAATALQSSHGRLDLLINASGILHGEAADPESGVSEPFMPETALARITPAALAACFAVNAAGPILVARAFVPLLIAGGKAEEAKAKEAGQAPASSLPSVLASISARVGSVSDNATGGWYSYRASKTALNQLNKTLSVELARKRAPVSAILLHPGTCDTDLSKPFQRNVPEGKLFSRERGAKQLLEIVGRATREDSGKFFAWDGQEVPW